MPQLARRMAVVAASLVLTAGCGSQASGPPLGKRAYIARADAICERARRDLHALGEPSTIGQLQRQAKRGSTILAASITDLRTLRAPTADQGTVDAWLAELDDEPPAWTSWGGSNATT